MIPASENRLISYLRKLQAYGLAIDHVYDVGACIGKWTRTMKQTALFNSKFYLFEANPAYEESLRLSNSDFIHIGVLSNPSRQEVDFYNGCDTGDSYYKETTKHYDDRKPIKLPCRTLDSVIEEFNLPVPQFLKMDTQGSELDILEGSTKIIGKTDLIYIECPIIEYNKGAPAIGDYLAYMKKYDYIPTDIFEIHRSENILLQVDIMFIKKETKEKLFGKPDFISV